MKFCFINYECYPLPIAYHLQQEGHEVLVGMIQSRNELKLPDVKDDEKLEDRKRRLSLYDGLLPKKTAAQVIEILRKVPLKEQKDWFFFFDFSDLYKISESVLRMGFRNGIFPTQFYYNMEKDRQKAKQFTEKYFPRVKVTKPFTFKKVEDGIEHINENEEIFALKSNGNYGKTVVPKTDDVEVARKLLIDTLQKYRKDYEIQGFMLEEKIQHAFEVTPVMVFQDGIPVYSLAEFENKEFGAGNIGVQKGGNQALSVRTAFDCELNKIAFPPAIYQLAKKQPGFSVYDAGLLYDGKDFYFTEFCAMRFGWDGIFSEIVMRDENQPFVGKYFEDVVATRNPLRNKYGASVRLFNVEGNSEETHEPKEDLPVLYDPAIENNLFLYRVKKKGNGLVNVAGMDFLGAITGAGETMESAVKKTYNRLEKFDFEKLYYRNQWDFLCENYYNSIPKRLAALEEYL